MPNFETSKEYVVFDLDGVLCDFSHSFSRLAATAYRVELVQTETQESFRWLRDQGVSKHEQDLLWDKIEVGQTFWSHMPSLVTDFDREAMWDLIDAGIQIIYLTNRHDKGTMITQTKEWLYRHGLPDGELVTVQDKDLYLRNRVAGARRDFNLLGVIEDSPYNLPKYESGLATEYVRPVVFVLDWKYNRDVALSLPRVGSVLEFCVRILELHEEAKEKLQGEDPLGGRYWQE